MKLKHFTVLLALLAMLGFTAGCGEEETTEDTPSTETPPEGDTAEGDTADDEAAGDETAEAEPAAGGDEAAEGGGDGACARARDCCNALVAATPGGAATAETTCASIATAESAPNSDVACNSLITGYRTTLQGLNAEIPDSCNTQ